MSAFNMDSLYSNMTATPVTKNEKSANEIKNMVAVHLPEEVVIQVSPATDGLYNAVYKVDCESGNRYFVKVAPLDHVEVMRHEQNIMENEVRVLDRLHQSGFSYAPKVIYYDTSKADCDSYWFLMNAVHGVTLAEKKKTISSDAALVLERQLGKLNKTLNCLTNSWFGFLVEEKGQFSSWYDTFYFMLENMIADSNRKAILLPFDKNKMLEQLHTERAVFDEVEIPHLVHWDLWDHNVIVDDKEIAGIIDFERSFYGDVLMENGFRSYNQSPSFLEGYGKCAFSEAEQRRIVWYDLYWFLFNMNEGIYREYNDDALFEWAKKMLCDCIAKILRGDVSNGEV